jgi:ankyrin repeat protein
MLRQLKLYLRRRKEKRLARAAEDGSLLQVRALLEAGVSPNATSDDGFSALMWAAARGHVEVVQVLLDHGAERDVLTTKGRTALDLAGQEGRGEVVALLQETADRP